MLRRIILINDATVREMAIYQDFHIMLYNITVHGILRDLIGTASKG